jgi:DNA-binding transcriptional MerR regulator
MDPVRDPALDLRTTVRLYSVFMTTLELTSIVACSLDADGAASRAAEFRAILAPNLRGVERDGATAVLDLALGARAQRALTELLRLERECCPFWRFDLSRRSPRRLRLEVTATSPHEAALDAFLSLTGSRESQERTFRAGEAARRAGVGVETLRYYERRGLLPRPLRRPSGQREYTLGDVRLVLAIKAAQRLGFTLAETQEIVRVTDRRGGHDAAGLREQVEAKLREVEGKIHGLELMRAELKAVIAAQCDTLIDCDCGDDCPIDGHAPRTATRLQVAR